MDDETRMDLIETYFDAVDAESYEPFERVFSADSRHVRPGQPDLVGADAIKSFFETERQSADSTHTVLRSMHADDDVTFCKIHVEGRLPDGRYEGDAVCEFTFDSATGTIAEYRLYRGYDR
jgi:ketosteroid isomerase-like protein